MLSDFDATTDIPMVELATLPVAASVPEATSQAEEQAIPAGAPTSKTIDS